MAPLPFFPVHCCGNWTDKFLFPVTSFVKARLLKQANPVKCGYNGINRLLNSFLRGTENGLMTSLCFNIKMYCFSQHSIPTTHTHHWLLSYWGIRLEQEKVPLKVFSLFLIEFSLFPLYFSSSPSWKKSRRYRYLWNDMEPFTTSLKNRVYSRNSH